MFHSIHHRPPTTIAVRDMAKPKQYVVFEDLAPTVEMPKVAPVRPPLTPSGRVWAQARHLAAVNDAALVPMDEREDTWYSTMLRRLATVHQHVKDTAALHARWEQFWQARQSQINQRKAATAAGLLRTAYAEGGTSQMAGLVAQVRQMMVENALGSGVAA